MTTLVALSTKDALVMGCDSLGTVAVPLIEPSKLRDYFDKDGNLKVNEKGEPSLKKYGEILVKSEMIPYSHMSHVSKLFSLSPLPMGVMATGIVSIGIRTIKSIITEFKTTDSAFNKNRHPTNYTVNSIGRRLLDFIWSHYCKEYPEETQYKPELELIIGGYDLQSQTPSTYRIYVHDNKIEPIFTNDTFGVAFGGEMKEIQRLVFGTDFANSVKIVNRNTYLLDKYYMLLLNGFKSQNIDITFKKPTEYKDELKFFDAGWKLNEYDANWGDFSEQNAIELVDFFINVMVKSQQFSNRLPTVGGEIHIGVICKSKGFRSVSGEEWRHGEHKIVVEED
jgi:hypothetical protein